MAGTRSLFVPGPTNVPEAIRRAIDIPMEDHRAPDQPEFLIPLLEDLKPVFGTTTGHPVLFPGSGTGGWEMALTNTLSPGDRILSARFGQFSHLWIDMCERLGFEVEVIDCDWGTGIPTNEMGARLAADTGHEIKAVLATHNETATGVTSDIGALRDAMDAAGHPALLFVDGVSSIASIPFHMDDWGVDIAVSGSQKGFMLPAGMAILAVSDKAIAAADSAQSVRCFFDLKAMLASNQTGFFPYTPPMALLRGLRAVLDRMAEEGLDQVYARHAYLAEGVRRAVAGWGLDLCARGPDWYSDTVSAIMVPEGTDANAVIKQAYHRYGLSLGGGLSRVAGKLFRIGHLGDLNELMLMQAIAGAEMAMRDCGIDIVPGSGAAAAAEYWRTARSESV